MKRKFKTRSYSIRAERTRRQSDAAPTGRTPATTGGTSLGNISEIVANGYGVSKTWSGRLQITTPSSLKKTAAKSPSRRFPLRRPSWQEPTRPVTPTLLETCTEFSIQAFPHPAYLHCEENTQFLSYTLFMDEGVNIRLSKAKIAEWRKIFVPPRTDPIATTSTR